MIRNLERLKQLFSIACLDHLGGLRVNELESTEEPSFRDPCPGNHEIMQTCMYILDKFLRYKRKRTATANRNKLLYIWKNRHVNRPL